MSFQELDPFLHLQEKFKREGYFVGVDEQSQGEWSAVLDG
jgi:hypothetical protein